MSNSLQSCKFSNQYLKPADDKIPFKINIKNPLFNNLIDLITLEIKNGQEITSSIYYIDKKEYQKIIDLIEDDKYRLGIIRDQLIFIYLKMRFAVIYKDYKTDNYNKVYESNKQFTSLYTLINKLVKKNKNISSISIKLKGEKEAHIINNQFALNYLLNVLAEYKNIENAQIYEEEFIRNQKQDNKQNYPTYGFQSITKNKESYYARLIFDLISQELTNNYISLNRKYLLVGKLMMLSKLLIVKHIDSDNNETYEARVIENIKKKIKRNPKNREK